MSASGVKYLCTFDSKEIKFDKKENLITVKDGVTYPDNHRMYLKENDMIDNSIIQKIIEERKRMHPDDPRVVEKWNELTQNFYLYGWNLKQKN